MLHREQTRIPQSLEGGVEKYDYIGLQTNQSIAREVCKRGINLSQATRFSDSRKFIDANCNTSIEFLN